MKSSSTVGNASPEFYCGHLSKFDTDAHVAMVRVKHAWAKYCVSCVTHHIGTSLKAGTNDAQIAKSVSFHCCGHEKQKNAGCSSCLASVKRAVWAVWFAFAPSQVLYLLTKSIRPKRKQLSPCTSVG